MTSPRPTVRRAGFRAYTLPAMGIICLLLLWARLIVVSDLPRTAIAEDPRAAGDNAGGPPAGASPSFVDRDEAASTSPDVLSTSPQNEKSHSDN